MSSYNSARTLATSIGEFLDCDYGVEMVANHNHIPTCSDVLRHFVHLQLSPKPPDKDKMLRFSWNILKIEKQIIV